VYYVGHGTGVIDAPAQEIKNQSFALDDGIIKEDQFITHLTDNKHPSSKIILINDACYEGTIWDIQDGKVNGKQLPANVVSLSASTVGPNAKRTVGQRNDRGVFTLALTKTLWDDPDIAPKDLAWEMQAALEPCMLSFGVGVSSPNLLDEPLLAVEKED
jgi:hypothetical protein